MTRAPVALLVLLSSLTVTACSTERVPIGTVTWEEVREAPVARLHAILGAGRVTIRPSDDGLLSVEAEVWLRASRTDELRDHPLAFPDHVLVEENEPGVVILRSAHDDDLDARDWELHVAIALPPAPDVRVEIDAGSATVKLPAAAGMTVDIDAGELEAELGAIRGSADLRLDAGEIRLIAHEELGAMRAEVTAGAIDVALPESFAGRIDAATEVGDVELAGRFDLEVGRELTAARATGAVGTAADGTGSVELRVQTGTIRVR